MQEQSRASMSIRSAQHAQNALVAASAAQKSSKQFVAIVLNLSQDPDPLDPAAP
jgi:hypothetical protein